MVRAGEAGGALETVLDRLADYLESQVRLRNKVGSILIYPLVMFGFALVVVGALVTVVLPQITQLLASLNQELPIYTRAIIAGSEFTRQWWWAMGLGGVAAFFAFRAATRTGAGRAAYDRFKLRLPVVGRLVRLLAISRFSRTLSTLLAGGLPITRALHTAGEVSANTVIAETVDAARMSITEGRQRGPAPARQRRVPTARHPHGGGGRAEWRAGGDARQGGRHLRRAGGDDGDATHRPARALPDPDHGGHRTRHHSRDARAALAGHELARLKPALPNAGRRGKMDRGPLERRTAARRDRRDGFTLIEIMAVVLIIGLLTTLVGIAIVPQIDKSRVSTARAQLKMLDAAIETFRMDVARFPTTEQGLEALIKEPSDVRNYQSGGYLREKRIPLDPWGNPYQYEQPGNHNDHSYDIWSFGADGVAGGEGVDADIGNWSGVAEG